MIQNALQDFRYVKVALAHFGRRFVFAQDTEYLSEMLNMLLRGLAENEDVISIADNKLVHLLAEYTTHDPPESGRSIA